MAVIEQEYDIDLKATGAFPVVKCSQFDTGSRTIVFTVYDNWELANIDGCVARVDGTRSDGVEFSSTCTVSTGSKVSFTISQEMTKHAGKHAAELVIFDASGNPAGTQNFVIDVEPAPMVRDSAASADDRTLYDQYTDSVEQKFSELSTSLTTKADALNKTVEDISGLVGASSKSVEILNTTVDTSTVSSTLSGKVYCRVVYDPLTALVTCRVSCDNSTLQKAGSGSYYLELGTLAEEYLPEARLFDYVDTEGRTVYRFFNDSLGGAEASAAINRDTVGNRHANAISYTMNYNATLEQDAGYRPDFTVSWYARGGKYIGVTPLPGGGGTGGSGYVLPVASASTLGGVKVGKGLAVTDDGTLSADHSGAGTDSIAIGVNAKSAGSVSTALGKDSNAGGNTSVAIGGGSTSGSASLAVLAGARTVGDVSIAIGMNSNAAASYSVAIGHVAIAEGSDSIAIGYGASAKGVYSVAVGYDSTADESNTFAVGSPSLLRRVVNVKEPIKDTDAATKAYVDNNMPGIATSSKAGIVKPGTGLTVTDDGTLSADTYALPPASASTLGGVKVGDNLTVTSDGTLSASGQVTDYASTETSTIIGRNASATGDNTNVTLVGHDTTATGKNSTTLGATTTAAEDSIAIGSGATAPNSQSTVIGRSATVTGYGGQGTVLGWQAASNGWSTALGARSQASGTASTASGTNAQATGDHATAIGATSSASGAYSVAIGSQSQAPDDNTVSVGADTIKRRITNVADPTDAQDAATKAYIDALIAKLKSDNNLK